MATKDSRRGSLGALSPRPSVLPLGPTVDLHSPVARFFDENQYATVQAACARLIPARLVVKVTAERLATLPAPAIVRMGSGAFMVFGGRNPSGLYRLVDPISHAVQRSEARRSFARDIGGQALLDRPTRSAARALIPATSACAGSCRPSGAIAVRSAMCWRRRLFVQIFALTTPLFFQVVVDKVLTHRGYETLFVLVGGLVAIGLFDVALQYLRTYALCPHHQSDRRRTWPAACLRIFSVCRFPISRRDRPGRRSPGCANSRRYAAFLTGQALFSALDLVFAFIFVGVLFAYSWSLTLIVLVGDSFLRGDRFFGAPAVARSGQGEVQSRRGKPAVSGRDDRRREHGEELRRSSLIMRAQWEEKLAAYVKTSFAAAMLGLRRAARHPVH